MTDQTDLPRLSKLMGERGLCSRREAEQWILRGWVRVDSELIKTLGVRVSRDARIDIDPLAFEKQRELVTALDLWKGIPWQVDRCVFDRASRQVLL